MESLDPSVRRWRLAAQGAAGLAALIGAFALLGCLTGSPLLRSWGEHYSRMPLDTALLFLLVGGAVFLLPFDLAEGRKTLLCCGVAALLIASVRLAQRYALPGITVQDRIFELPADAVDVAPMMGLTSATTFIVAVAALLLLLAPARHRRLMDALAAFAGVIVGFIGLIHFLGYLYGRPLHAGGQMVSTPLNAAVAFLCLGVAETLLAVLRDLSARRKDRRLQDAHHAATAILTESGDLPEAADKILAAIGERLGWPHGALWTREGSRGLLRCVSAWSAPGRPELAKLAALSRSGAFARGIGLPGRAWASRAVVWINHAKEDSEFARRAAAQHAGLGGGLAAPLLSRQEDVLGVLEFFHPKIHPPTAEERVFLENAASQVASFIKRKQAEEAVGSEHNLLRSLIDNLPDHIYLKDTKGHYVLDNLSHLRFLGLGNTSQIIGKTVHDLFPSENAARYDSADQAVMNSGAPLFNYEESLLNALGETRWLSTSKLPFHDETGKLIGLICVARDITARKQTEEDLQSAQLQLIQAEKLESLGRLAAGIAHEVKNPLALILMGAEYLAGEASGLAEGEVTQEVIGQIRDAAMRADVIIRGMLDFSAPSQLELRPTEMEDLLHKTLPLVQHEMNAANVQLEKRFASQLPTALLDSNKIKQVFINLCTNAVHAMPEGGTLTVRTSVQMFASGEALPARDEGSRQNERLRPGDPTIVVEIDDTGTGVPPDKLAYLFEPFYTTKPTGKGTGLGLSVTKKIMEMHGGDIRISNRAEGGARVTLLFKACAVDRQDAMPDSKLADVGASV